MRGLGRPPSSVAKEKAGSSTRLRVQWLARTSYQPSMYFFQTPLLSAYRPKRYVAVGCGSKGSRSSFMPDSASVRLPFFRLHREHAATRFLHVGWPSRCLGTTWSIVSSLVRRPQYWHRYPSRRSISRLQSRTRGRGRRTTYSNRMTEGHSYVRDTVRMTPRPFSRTLAFPAKMRPIARLVVQAWIGSKLPFSIRTGWCSVTSIQCTYERRMPHRILGIWMNPKGV